MDRSFAGRLGIGSLTRPQGRTKARPKRTRTRGRAASTGAATNPIDVAIAALLRAPSTLASLLSQLWSFLGAHRRARIALIALLIALPLMGGGWLWLRHSSFVSVERVRISGVHGTESQAIDAALTHAARQMSTLDVQTARLRAAVASYPSVGDVRVHTSFPHGLSIEVVEQPAVATLTAGGVKTAVAANGVVLGAAHASASLPTLTSKVALTPGEHVLEAGVRGELEVLGAAPAALAKSVERAYSGPKGLTLVLGGGLQAYFGDASRPHAKWASLARVLADAGSAGATYVDVRLPERPAAGFHEAPPPIEGSEAEGSGSTASGTGSSESLTESLAAAAGGGAATEAKTESSEEASGSKSEASGESEGAEEPSEHNESTGTEATSEASG
ncbi:MAG TPA: FtsQ-type POTRA domain-containing protein [Solirubrobacteraceae bacterium]|nr:FtsQ-type POTRA domain-containing protein [Solirubrobacteraceae bacterium]